MGRHCAAVLLMLTATLAWAGELPPNQWVPLNELNAGVQLLGWDEIRYCPELEGMLFYGAYRSFTSENQNAVWLYRYKENRWHLLHINLFWARSEMASDAEVGNTVSLEAHAKLVYTETSRLVHLRKEL